MVKQGGSLHLACGLVCWTAGRLKMSHIPNGPDPYDRAGVGAILALVGHEGKRGIRGECDWKGESFVNSLFLVNFE